MDFSPGSIDPLPRLTKKAPASWAISPTTGKRMKSSAAAIFGVGMPISGREKVIKLKSMKSKYERCVGARIMKGLISSDDALIDLATFDREVISTVTSVVVKCSNFETNRPMNLIV